MGALGGLAGLAGGASGTGFAAPTGVPIQEAVSTDQTNNAYAGNQAALAQQQGLVTALQGQNGIGNQSQVYNQLQGVANGTGPNPAQAMLNQATGQNVNNQAALMAGQRGAGSNVGLIARQAAMQGANTQQQAVGQGATMQANQSLNALGQAGNIAGQQVGNQIGATTSYTQAQQNEQQQLLNAIAQQNNARVGMQSNINSGNAGLANTTMQGQQKGVGGVFNSLGGAAGGGGGARGGMVGYADGGDVSGMQQFASAPKSDSPSGMQAMMKLAPLMAASGGQVGPQSSFGQFLASSQNKSAAPQPVAMAEGGKVPALVSPGERYLPPSEVKAVVAGKKNPMQAGEKIPGKPKVGGAVNSYQNDFVRKTLDEGGVILPRSVTKSKHPHWEAHKFMLALAAKKGLK